jgi:hypothetical protein
MKSKHVPEYIISSYSCALIVCLFTCYPLSGSVRTSYMPIPVTAPPGLQLKNSTWWSLWVQCFVRISEQTAAFAVYIIKWLVFIIVVESVYSAVRTDSLYKADYVWKAKGDRGRQASRDHRPRWPSRLNESLSALISRTPFGYMTEVSRDFPQL